MRSRARCESATSCSSGVTRSLAQWSDERGRREEARARIYAVLPGVHRECVAVAVRPSEGSHGNSTVARRDARPSDVASRATGLPTCPASIPARSRARKPSTRSEVSGCAERGLTTTRKATEKAVIRGVTACLAQDSADQDSRGSQDCRRGRDLDPPAGLPVAACPARAPPLANQIRHRRVPQRCLTSAHPVDRPHAVRPQLRPGGSTTRRVHGGALRVRARAPLQGCFPGARVQSVPQWRHYGGRAAPPRQPPSGQLR
jgi:hypothetical protein